jgi:hypothetical protein
LMLIMRFFAPNIFLSNTCTLFSSAVTITSSIFTSPKKSSYSIFGELATDELLFAAS